MTASSGGCDVLRYLRTDRIIFAQSGRQMTGIVSHSFIIRLLWGTGHVYI